MPLSIDDKQEVLEALFPARDKWRSIGGALGLKDDDQQCIDNEQKSNGDKLDRVIARWLHNGVNCTWVAVSEALRNVTVGRPDLAEKVEKKYLQTRPPEDSELTMDDLLEVAGYLQGLNKGHLRTLGLILGLTANTVDETYDGSGVGGYRHSILEAWLMQQDRVGEKGAPTWRVLAGALENQQLRQSGIATKIRKEKNL